LYLAIITFVFQVLVPKAIPLTTLSQAKARSPSSSLNGYLELVATPYYV